MIKILISIFACLMLLHLACYDNKLQSFSEANWANEKGFDSSSPKPVNDKGLIQIPPQKMALPQKFIDALATSRKTWENLKKASHNTYSYLLESGVSGWTQNRYQTIIEVQQGIIADYTLRPIEGSISDQMRKHSPARKTLDELYEECEKEIIPNLMDYQWFVLDFFENGVLAACHYDICGLQDSEGQGIDLRAMALQRTKTFGAQHFMKGGYLKRDCK